MKKNMQVLGKNKPVIGMIHLQALPGTPNNKYRPHKIKEEALKELKLFLEAEIDGKD